EYSAIENDVTERLEKTADALRNGLAGSVEITTANRPFIRETEVLDPVDKTRTWLIVIGDRARNRTPRALIRGSFTTDIIEKAFCPVLLVPESLHLTGNFTIAFASNLEAQEDQALAELATFANVFGSGILVIHISKTRLQETDQLSYHRALGQITGAFRYLATDYEEIESSGVTERLAELTRDADVRVLALVHNRYSFFKRLFESRYTRETLNYHHAMLLVLPQTSQ
ncbi:MAG TPA: universal stress protein, partial [Sphingobacteriaceae bacterium]